MPKTCALQPTKQFSQSPPGRENPNNAKRRKLGAADRMLSEPNRSRSPDKEPESSNTRLPPAIQRSTLRTAQHPLLFRGIQEAPTFAADFVPHPPRGVAISQPPSEADETDEWNRKRALLGIEMQPVVTAAQNVLPLPTKSKLDIVRTTGSPYASFPTMVLDAVRKVKLACKPENRWSIQDAVADIKEIEIYANQQGFAVPFLEPILSETLRASLENPAMFDVSTLLLYALQDNARAAGKPTLNYTEELRNAGMVHWKYRKRPGVWKPATQPEKVFELMAQNARAVQRQVPIIFSQILETVKYDIKTCHNDETDEVAKSGLRILSKNARYVSEEHAVTVVENLLQSLEKDIQKYFKWIKVEINHDSGPGDHTLDIFEKRLFKTVSFLKLAAKSFRSQAPDVDMWLFSEATDLLISLDSNRLKKNVDILVRLFDFTGDNKDPAEKLPVEKTAHLVQMATDFRRTGDLEVSVKLFRLISRITEPTGQKVPDETQALLRKTHQYFENNKFQEAKEVLKDLVHNVDDSGAPMPNILGLIPHLLKMEWKNPP